MRPNDQKYVPDPRSRSPGINNYQNMASDFQNSNAGFSGQDRMSFVPQDFNRMNSGGMLQQPQSKNFTQMPYERDFKSPNQYSAPTPQQYPATDFKSNNYLNQGFVPRSKYLQEEMKMNDFGKDFGYTPAPAPKPMQMNSNFGNMQIPQPACYEAKPELQK